MLIELKRRFADQELKHVFECLGHLVEQGSVAFSAAVRREVGNVQTLDDAAKWVRQHYGDVRFPTEPGERLIGAALECGQRMSRMIDEEGADGDSMVLAHALQIKEMGYAVTVVTLDVRKKRGVVSLDESCQNCGLSTLNSANDFLSAVGCQPPT